MGLGIHNCVNYLDYAPLLVVGKPFRRRILPHTKG